MYEMILSLEGYQIYKSTNNGENAVKIFKSRCEKPDIILIDHRMPVKTGLEAAQEILELDKNSKIIFTSADYRIKEKALAIGAISFIQKPFSHEVLIKEIEKVINLHNSII